MLATVETGPKSAATLRRDALARTVRRALTGIGATLCLAAVWQVVSHLVGNSRLPGFFGTLDLLVRSLVMDPIISSQAGRDEGYLPHVLATSYATGGGLLVGAVAGIPIGLALSVSSGGRQVGQWIVDLVRGLPPLILVPFALLLVTNLATIPFIVVGFYSLLLMSMYAYSASSGTSRVYYEQAKVMGASRWSLFARVLGPATLPVLLGGIRTTATLGAGISVVCEYLAAPKGIGRVMKYALSYSRIDLIVVGAVWCVLVVFAVNTLVSIIGIPAVRWSPQGIGETMVLRESVPEQ